MGIRTVFTDHSLFGLQDLAEFQMAKLLKVFLRDVDHAIGVSHTCRLNMALRHSLDLKITSAIPNAIDPKNFLPDPSKRYPLNKINIVHVSRLCYRKGTDLLIDIIPAICKKYPNVHFIIGGDGDKRAILEKMRKEHKLEDRVEMLGFLRGCEAVRNTLVRGHIFLNVSLTESFCIAILEAACAGLMVVTTNVGGIPEVLPGEMMFAADPNSDDLIAKIEQAIPLTKNIPSYEFHKKIEKMYN